VSISMIEDQLDKTKDDLIRERLLLTAMQEFMHFGFSRISMDDLAIRMGMSKKTVYKYYASKEELVKAVLELRKQRVGELMSFIETKVPKHAFGEKIVQVSQKVAEFLSEIQPHVMFDLKKSFPLIFDDFDTFRKASIVKGFTIALNEGRASGVFRDDIPIELAVHMHLTLISTMMNPEYLTSQQYTPLQVFTMILRCTMEGLCTNKGRSIVEASLFTKTVL
jgi:AcrR family transcriptional regulator